MMIPLCGGKAALPGITWVWVCGWKQIWRDSDRVPKRLATVTGS